MYTKRARIDSLEGREEEDERERERQRDTVQYTSIIGSPFCFFYQRN